MRRRLWFVLRMVMGTVAVVGVAAPALSEGWPLFDLASDLTVTWFVLTAMAAMVAFVAKARRLGVAMAVAVVVQALPLLAWYETATSPRPDGARDLRVLTFNVEWPEHNVDAVLALVDAVDPDVFVAQELTEAWLSGLEPLRRRYPYWLVEPRPQHYGLGIFSKRRLQRLPKPRDPALAPHVLPVRLDPALGCARLLAVHTYRTKPLEVGRRNRQLAALASMVRSGRGLDVVAGDFNVSPFSAHYRRFMRASGLRNTRFGLAPTFSVPGLLPDAIFDYVLVSPGIGVEGFAVEREAGSDHLPVRVDLALRSRADCESETK